jgi:SAM-dependent methyltransferase
VNGLRYAKDVASDVLRYRAHKIGLGTGEMAFATHDEYDLKEADQTSHRRIVQWFERKPPSRVLDLGCGDGRLAELLRACGHEVTGVDQRKSEGVGGRVDRFFDADLDRGIPDEVGGGYDIVLAADVLEHVRDPRALLIECREHLGPHGTVIASIPNIGHWYPRVRVALGRFDYDRRGILDVGHVRFFTRRSFERIATSAGLTQRRRESIGLPLEVLSRGSRDKNDRVTLLGTTERIAVDLWPTLFGFQFLYELEPSRSDT